MATPNKKVTYHTKTTGGQKLAIHFESIEDMDLASIIRAAIAKSRDLGEFWEDPSFKEIERDLRHALEKAVKR